MTLKQLTVMMDSPFLNPNFIMYMDLQNSRYQYEIFERVFLNVASYYQVPYREMMNAERSDDELYAYLCLSLIIIDQNLEKVFQLHSADRKILIGERWSMVLSDYNNKSGKSVT
jgi:hypothetical protein